jgi:hypothetical protein
VKRLRDQVGATLRTVAKLGGSATAGVVGATAGAVVWLKRPKPVPPRGIYVQMGSSITAGLHGPGANLTPIIVGSRLNLTAVNVGFDGGYADILNRPNLDELSLCWLVDAIMSRDWSAQEDAMICGHAAESLRRARWMMI